MQASHRARSSENLILLDVCKSIVVEKFKEEENNIWLISDIK